MKSLTKQLVAVTIVALLAGGIVAGEDGATDKAEDASTTKEREAEQLLKTQKDRHEAAVSQRYGGYGGSYAGYGAQPAGSYGRGGGGSYGGGYGGFGTQMVSTAAGLDKHSVLVIPSGDIKPEELTATIKDMNVMCRILEKQLRGASLLQEGGWPSVGRGLFGQEVPAIEGIYLDGYGALFLINVDFPLAPPVRPEEQKEEAADVDQVWEQAKRELYSGKEALEATGECQEAVYDADKVENLITRIVKSLKHASNIRNLGPDECTVIAVSGWAGRAGSASFKGFGYVVKVPLPSPKTGLSERTVLTIRAQKADIDALASGEINWDTFRSTVQTVTYSEQTESLEVRKHNP